MSEGVKASTGERRRGFRIHNPRDFYGGLALLGLALFALWASSDLPGMRGFAFGPGTAPRLFAIILAVLGFAVALVGLFTEGPGLERFSIRGPVFITASTLLFAVTIRQFGLIIASYLSIVVAAAATPEVRWLETLLWAAFLTAFCVVLFPIALNLPMQLWPYNLTFSNFLSFR
jgi:putative tricarboxylic transport membrane protein